MVGEEPDQLPTPSATTGIQREEATVNATRELYTVKTENAELKRRLFLLEQQFLQRQPPREPLSRIPHQVDGYLGRQEEVLSNEMDDVVTVRKTKLSFPSKLPSTADERQIQIWKNQALSFLIHPDGGPDINRLLGVLQDTLFMYDAQTTYEKYLPQFQEVLKKAVTSVDETTRKRMAIMHDELNRKCFQEIVVGLKRTPLADTHRHVVDNLDKFNMRRVGTSLSDCSINKYCLQFLQKLAKMGDDRIPDSSAITYFLNGLTDTLKCFVLRAVPNENDRTLDRLMNVAMQVAKDGDPILNRHNEQLAAMEGGQANDTSKAPDQPHYTYVPKKPPGGRGGGPGRGNSRPDREGAHVGNEQRADPVFTNSQSRFPVHCMTCGHLHGNMDACIYPNDEEQANLNVKRKRDRLKQRQRQKEK